MTDKLSRRSILSLMPASTAALLLPRGAAASDQTAILAVIQEMEGYQGWESAHVAWTKAYCAYRLRQALQMDLPDPGAAEGHLYCQKGSWDAYTRTFQYGRDQIEGRLYTPPPAHLSASFDPPAAGLTPALAKAKTESATQ